MTDPKKALYPLTPMQRGMLLHHLEDAHRGTEILQVIGDLEETIDFPRFRAAFESVFRAHDAFSLAFTWSNGEETQSAVESAGLPVDFRDFSDLAESAKATAWRELLENDRSRGFSLDRAPATRVTVVKFSASSTRILWTHHHIILDGRSELPIIEEVFAAYDRGLAPLPRSRRFVDCIAPILDLQEAEINARIDEIFADFDGPTPLPFDRPKNRTESGYDEIEDRLENAARASDYAARANVGESTIVLAAWAMTLARLAAVDDVLFGEVRSGRYFDSRVADDLIGNFINTLPARVRIFDETTIGDLLRGIRESGRKNRPFEHMPLYSVLRRIGRRSQEPLFESVVIYDGYLLAEELKRRSASFEKRNFRLIDQPSVPLALYAYRSDQRLFRIVFDRSRIDRRDAETIARTFRRAVDLIISAPLEARVVDLDPLPQDEIDREIRASMGPVLPINPERTIFDEFKDAAARHPDETALVDERGSLTYAALARRIEELRGHLAAAGAGRGRLVGVMLDRTNDLVVSIMSILSLGAAYVPLDPEYPRARLEDIARDAETLFIVTTRSIVDRVGDFGTKTFLLDSAETLAPRKSDDRPLARDCAYLLFTSGSTGKPKGVIVRHENVVNFFAGLDRLLDDADARRTWLAVTSLSFDIAGLELLWTICRGHCVCIAGAPRTFFGGGEMSNDERAPDFSLFYFAGSEDAAGRGKYDLLFEGARFADQAGFKAVWTPERHFHDFGGLYPNPAVIGAAIAATTKSVEIRAGSVVLPLQDPLRVAEEWSVVDNLSAGRVGVSFASGWHADDFILSPENFPDRVAIMYRDIDLVKRLWRGESIERRNGAGDIVAIGIHPRPVQKELPVWITSGGHPETFRSAGRIGANLLTHLLGQELDDLERKIAIYREARAAAGHDPKAGCVTLMIHTFVGKDRPSVRRAVKGPLIAYLSTSADLVRKLAKTLEHSPESGNLDTAAMQDFLERRFDRYFERCGLFGTPDECVEIVKKLTALGVDEISCLVDFGIGKNDVVASFPLLEEVFRRTRAKSDEAPHRSLAAWIEGHDITHLQTTPSLAGMMLADERTRSSLARLRTLLIGGEALTSTLVADLESATKARIFNMYGPTETTIWSTATEVRPPHSAIVSIGRPLANQTARIVDRRLRPMPFGEIGEILIGGRGVTDGYKNRPELTQERFPIDPDRSSTSSEERAYRTGDRGRRRPDGSIEFLGRSDFQIKFRGHRIELGEIEAAIESLPSIARAVVHFRDEEPRLVAYIERRPGATIAERDIADRISQRLAAIMVPQAFVFLTEWPLTPNKKVDRRALPAPIVGTSRPIEEFRGEVEQRLGDVWRRVLNVASFGPNDNYFDLGGHSLLAIQLLAEVRREFSVKLSLADLFAAPTVRSQTSIIEERLLAQASDDDLAALLEDLEGLSDDEVMRRLEDRG